MTRQWELESTTGRCTVTGRTLREGEEFFTVLFADGESFRRADYSTEGWEGPPEGCYCHFKTRIPVKAKRKKFLVDDELLVSFFTRLADETEPVRVHFRFVLALILMRKRLLRYEGSTVAEGGEVWDMVYVRDKQTHRIVNPHLTDDQIRDVSEQLGAILHGDMGEWAAERGGLIPSEPTDAQEAP